MKNNIIIIVILLFLFISCSQRNPLFNSLESEKKNTGGTAFGGDPPLHYDPEAYWIKEVIEYKPAWGQHVNKSDYNDINKLYGAPVSGAHDIVSLGSGGGYVIVRFDPPILNHPDNINSYDFIIFGNAFFTGANERWQEPAYVEVMKDENGDGITNETWYLLKGSDTTPGSFISVTNNRTNLNYKPADKDHYPSTDYYPLYPDQITFIIFPFPPEKTGQTSENIRGYADVTPTLDNPGVPDETFYTVPDTPGDYPIDDGSGGGDAFKIEWAVDRNTGAPVVLDQIDFIKIISTATNTLELVGEVSADIDAVARVRRNK